MIIAMLLLATSPSAEAQALGTRLARTGTLAALLPLMAAKETEELVAQHKELSQAEQGQLRATAQEVATAGAERLFAAEGNAYAANLSVEDLRALVTHSESGAAARMRTAMPKVIAQTMQSAGSIDFKKETLAAFCQRTGKGCTP